MAQEASDLADELLVSYLDGELPKDKMRSVEAAAAEHTSVRHRLQQLQSSWELLDELPDVPAKTSVAQSTLELVALELNGSSSRWQKLAAYKVPIFIFCAILLTGSGIAVGKYRAWRQEEELLSQLPLIIAKERLQIIPDRAFMDLLVSIDQLVELGISAGRGERNRGGTRQRSQNQSSNKHAGASEPERRESPKLSPRQVFEMNNTERRQWIDSLDEADQQELAAMLRDFQRAQRGNDQGGLTRAANNFKTLEGIERGERMRYVAAISGYHQLTEASSRFEIGMQEAVDEGDVDLQREMIYSELAYRYQLTDADRRAIEDWVDYYLNETLKYAAYRLGSDLGNPEILQLVDQLEPELAGNARAIFREVKDERRVDVLFWWLEQMTSEDVLDDEELRDRFEKLPRRTRDDLLYLPVEEAHRRLRSNVSENGF
ncbi:MAG TPA: hypothetical protein DDW52_25170 [Planctomycetaceae bacterium]|nr:hypothetical protein [Planctomycetaceae bacterium]